MTERIIETRIGPEGDATRLLAYLCRRFTYCSLAQWQAFIDEGRVQVDGQPGQADQWLSRGQALVFKPPAELEPAVDTGYSIVHEDSQFLVVYKPPLLPIHPGGRFFAHTLWYLLTRDVGKVHIATRLDRETSGLVLAARDPATARYLQEQQGLGAIQKRYLALVHGSFPAGQTRAQGWLVPDQRSAVRKKRRFLRAIEPVDPFKENTITDAMPGAESCGTLLTGRGSWQAEDGERSLVEARLLTGRTHQIRASLLSLGYPVLGDKLYGLDEGFFLRFMEDSLTPADLARLVLPYQALHCGSLEFQGRDGSRLAFSTPPPWESLVKPIGTQEGYSIRQ